MFFYVDESGHTGANLFDENQPYLYYGVLSSNLNVDILARKPLISLRKRLGVKRLHAAELGNGRLIEIIDDVVKIRKKLDLRFDICRVAKTDHALICFFDQVFDKGVNPAITWTGYWSPLRYVLLLKVAYLFDDETLKKAWNARIETNDVTAESLLVEVCKTLKGRVESLPDQRSRTLICDTLTWAEKHTSEIHYNTKSKKDILQVTPNLIGFQSVIHGIALRLKGGKKEAACITVDHQSQFNKAQRTLSEIYTSVKGEQIPTGLGLPVMDMRHIPSVPLTFMSGADSAGLELVDIYLWIYKRFMERKELAPQLLAFLKRESARSKIDEVSINAIVARWSKVFNNLPEPTEEQLNQAKEMIALDDARRLDAIAKTSQPAATAASADAPPLAP
jgi:hypothetical protein